MDKKGKSEHRCIATISPENACQDPTDERSISNKVEIPVTICVDRLTTQWTFQMRTVCADGRTPLGKRAGGSLLSTNQNSLMRSEKDRLVVVSSQKS
eukprot:scaffold923_cov85-Cylindrotheca_fusiformis.AAC.3